MFFENLRKQKINDKILDLKNALFNFKIENDGYLYDTNSIIYLIGISFARSQMHF